MSLPQRLGSLARTRCRTSASRREGSRGSQAGGDGSPRKARSSLPERVAALRAVAACGPVTWQWREQAPRNMPGRRVTLRVVTEDGRHQSVDRKKTLSEGPGGAATQGEVTGGLSSEGHEGEDSAPGMLCPGSWCAAGPGGNPGLCPAHGPLLSPPRPVQAPGLGACVPQHLPTPTPNPIAAGRPLFTDAAACETCWGWCCRAASGRGLTALRGFPHSAGATAAFSASSGGPSYCTGHGFGTPVGFSLTSQPCGGESMMMPFPMVTE